MFVRVKPSGRYKYLQIVENSREGKKVKQQVLCTLGRLDRLTESGKLDSFTESLLRFSKKLKVINMYKQDQVKVLRDVSIGPALVFERIWKDLKLEEIIREVGSGRNYQFELERAIFLTVLHRLFESGSDRKTEKWKQDYNISGVEGIELHQLYRAMAWLGESKGIGISKGREGYEQHIKEKIEWLLFEKNRDLFSTLEVVFFDTTSIYFEGEGGSLGENGHSKDHRPDLKQIVVGVVLDQEGRPICSEVLPGNTADAKTLLPVIVRLKQRFGINSFCIVADRGMVSKRLMETLESPSFRINYIFGSRMRRQKEVREKVLGSEGSRYKEVPIARAGKTNPLLLKVKEVTVNGKRYVVCYNPEQAKKDALDREAIVESLKERLKRGDKALVGNKGYRKYLKVREGEAFEIDYEKLKEEAIYDGKWVLQTNTDYSAEEVAVQYKQLWMVEKAFRTVKSVLETRPIYHRCEETIRGHIFCSFLALIMMKELYSRLEEKGYHFEWEDILRDLEALREVTLEMKGEKYYLRTELRGTCYSVLNAVGVAVPPRVRN